MFSHKNNRILSLKAILITLTFILAVTVICCMVSENFLLPICNTTKSWYRVSPLLFQLLIIWNFWVKVDGDSIYDFLLLASLEIWRQKKSKRTKPKKPLFTQSIPHSSYKQTKDPNFPCPLRVNCCAFGG